MATFAYTAVGRDGKRTSGTLSADNRSAAISQVTRLGLHPVKMDEDRKGKPATVKSAAKPTVSAKNAGPAKPGMPTVTLPPPPIAGTLKVSQKLIEGFTRELANLLGGGVSLARALALLKREASNASARALWTSIHDDVVGGTSLADALAKFPRSFTTVYVAMVRAGEAGGFIDVVLQQIADFRTREADLKGKVKAALVYPIILATFAVAVVAFLLTWFIPRFSGIFKEFGGELPALTKGIVFASNLLKDYGIFILIALVIGIFVFRQAVQTDVGRRRFEKTILSIPVLGSVIAHFALVRFCRMLGTLIGAGVPLVMSLKTAREAIGNQTLADTVSQGIEEVQRGQALSKSLAESPRLFPASVVETIAVAEETGRLDKELVRLATSYESDLDRQLRMLVAVAEPLLLFTMAGIIGTVVVGMLLPVFNLQDLIK